MVQTGGSGSIRDDAWLLYGPLDAFKLGILRSNCPRDDGILYGYYLISCAPQTVNGQSDWTSVIRFWL
jgi:hypothetical protein